MKKDLEPEEWMFGLIGFTSPTETMDYNQKKGGGVVGCIAYTLAWLLLVVIFFTVIAVIFFGKV